MADNDRTTLSSFFREFTPKSNASTATVGRTSCASKTVEPVIGTLVNFTNMKRVNTRGIKNANKHVLMASLTYNLKKYLRFVVKNPSILAQVVSLKVAKGKALLKTIIRGFKNTFLSNHNFTILNNN